MKELKFGDSTGNRAISHLRANRITLARRINEIAGRMVHLKTELEMLDDEMKAKLQQLNEVECGIRVLGGDDIGALRARRLADMSRHPSAQS
jgi:hypothetical protein